MSFDDDQSSQPDQNGVSSSDNTAAQHRLSKLDSASKFSEELGKLTGDKVPAASSKDEKAAEEKSSDEEEENKKE